MKPSLSSAYFHQNYFLLLVSLLTCEKNQIIIFNIRMNRPVSLVCYICGRQFGTHSLAIHLKTCEKKWENQQNLLPPKQRRPCPKPPKGFDELASKGKITKEDMNKFNAKSYDAFVEEALVQCEYCGRRFNEKSLIPHQKACKTHPMVRKPFVNKGPMGKYAQQDQPINTKNTSSNYKIAEDYDAPQNSNLVPCRRCGRKFNADRVGKHENVCKGERVQVHQKKQEYKEEVKPTKMKPNFGKEKKAKWKVQHEELQNAMKMMRQMRAVEAKGGKISDMPPPPPSNYDHYVQCRHCGRKYAENVAQRHIPKCANIINKPGGIKPSRIQEKYISGTGSGAKNWGNSSNMVSSKPMMMPTKPNPTSSNSYVKPPSSNPFGDPYPSSSKNNYSYGSNQQSNSGKGYNISPFEKPSTSQKTEAFNKAPNAAKNEASNKLKPNFNTRTNPSNYW